MTAQSLEIGQAPPSLSSENVNVVNPYRTWTVANRRKCKGSQILLLPAPNSEPRPQTVQRAAGFAGSTGSAQL